ncbi:MAG: ABC transporter permease [Anaerolineaceae bacterium]|nr:ABC transporter permease [Anaerolineaceae bacterium]
MSGLTKEYVIKRIGMFLITVWLGTSIIFFVPRLVPGDPVQAMIGRLMQEGAEVANAEQIIDAWRVRFGLDKPLLVQYFRYLYNSFTFDTGYSLAFFPTRVDDMVIRAMPWTLGLLSVATIISFVLGNLIGALLAWRGTPRLLRMLLPISLIFTAIPAFMLGILLLYLFAFNLDLLPYGGGYERGAIPGFNWEFISSVVQHAILPAFAVVIVSMGSWALGMRGMMITTDGEDYMILAEAKGLSPARIFWRYGIRNAILPQVTALGITLGALAGGFVVVELIFTYPGMGYLLYRAILNTDYTLIQGIVFYVIVGVSFAVLILDFIYPLIDPRITFKRS